MLTLFLSTIVCSKKLTETAFCVTKNRFFLIRFLICITKQQLGLVRSHSVSFAIIAQLPLGCQAFFTTFFEIFSEFSEAISESFCCLALADSLFILSYPYSKVNCFSQLFFGFFTKILSFFRHHNRLCFVFDYATI